MGETADVWKHRRHIGVGYAEPAGQRRRKFIYAGSRDPPSVFGIVWTIDRKCWERAIESIASHRSAHDKLMAAPPVIAATAIARQRTSEIRRRKRGNRLIYAEFNRR